MTISFYPRPRSKQRLSRLRAGFWWTAIYHVEVKGQANCPARSTSGATSQVSLGGDSTGDTAAGDGGGMGDAAVNVRRPARRAAPMASDQRAASSGQRSRVQSAKHRLMLKQACGHADRKQAS